MLVKNANIHFKIVNFWLSFVLFLLVISNLPHQPAPFFSWFNVSIYFFIFLQALALFRHEAHNRLIYLNIAIFSLCHSLSFANIFVGETYLVQDDYLRYFLFEYKHIVLSGVTALCIVYICLKYFLHEFRKNGVYLLSVAVVLLILCWQYYPFLLDKEYILEVEDAFLYRSAMLFDLLPLFFLVLYGLLLYRYDWSLGEHINTLMISFFIMTVMDLTNYFGNIYQITIFQYTQYVLMVNLTFLAITMTRLLNLSYSKYGELYHSILSAGDMLGVPIKRKRTSGDILFDFAKAYFGERRNVVAVVALTALCGVNLLSHSLFIKINLSVMLLGSLFLFYYLTALYQRRANSGNIINMKERRDSIS